jgi:hypothetical protein
MGLLWQMASLELRFRPFHFHTNTRTQPESGGKYSEKNNSLKNKNKHSRKLLKKQVQGFLPPPARPRHTRP